MIFERTTNSASINRHKLFWFTIFTDESRFACHLNPYLSNKFLPLQIVIQLDLSISTSCNLYLEFDKRFSILFGFPFSPTNYNCLLTIILDFEESIQNLWDKYFSYELNIFFVCFLYGSIQNSSFLPSFFDVSCICASQDFIEEFLIFTNNLKQINLLFVMFIADIICSFPITHFFKPGFLFSNLLLNVNNIWPLSKGTFPWHVLIIIFSSHVRFFYRSMIYFLNIEFLVNSFTIITLSSFL